MLEMGAEQLRLDGRTLDDCINESHAIWADATAEHRPVKTFALVSGGNDSTTLLHFVRDGIDAAVHINTGTGIPATSQFVRDLCADWNIPLIEMHPPRPYRDLVLGKDPTFPAGFPGPGAHFYIYNRLKERSVRKLLADNRTARGQRFVLLTGIRNAESKIRMGYSNPVDRIGGQVWVNPLLRWSNTDMAAYRARHTLPVNEVTEHLHMSGECLCGAYASPGELDMIAMFYPEHAAWIRALEAEVEAAGIPACKWGQKPPGQKATAGGPMCQSCDLRLFEEDAA